MFLATAITGLAASEPDDDKRMTRGALISEKSVCLFPKAKSEWLAIE